MQGICCSSCSGTIPRAEEHHQHPTLIKGCWFTAPRHPQAWHCKKTPCCYRGCIKPGLQTAQLHPAPLPSRGTDAPTRPAQSLGFGSALQDPLVGLHPSPCTL